MRATPFVGTGVIFNSDAIPLESARGGQPLRRFQDSVDGGLDNGHSKGHGIGMPCLRISILRLRISILWQRHATRYAVAHANHSAFHAKYG